MFPEWMWIRTKYLIYVPMAGHVAQLGECSTPALIGMGTNPGASSIAFREPRSHKSTQPWSIPGLSWNTSLGWNTRLVKTSMAYSAIAKSIESKNLPYLVKVRGQENAICFSLNHSDNSTCQGIRDINHCLHRWARMSHYLIVHQNTPLLP